MRSLRYCLMLCLLVLLCAAPAMTAAASPPHPHIIFMLADDFGHNNWQHSNPDLISPNLDTLVADGMLLKRHYVYKVC